MLEVVLRSRVVSLEEAVSRLSLPVLEEMVLWHTVRLPETVFAVLRGLSRDFLEAPPEGTGVAPDGRGHFVDLDGAGRGTYISSVAAAGFYLLSVGITLVERLAVVEVLGGLWHRAYKEDNTPVREILTGGKYRFPSYLGRTYRLNVRVNKALAGRIGSLAYDLGVERPTVIILGLLVAIAQSRHAVPTGYRNRAVRALEDFISWAEARIDEVHAIQGNDPAWSWQDPFFWELFNEDMHSDDD